MRQALAAGITLALVAIALLLPPPADPPEPPQVAGVYPGSATSIGFCPAWTADDEVRSRLVLGVTDEIEVSASFQAADETLVEQATRSGPGTVSADPGLAQGYLPVLVESRSGDPVAGAVVTRAPGIAAASGCARWPATTWTVGIGGTLSDESSTLLLHNPTAQASTVSVTIYSEQGLEIVEGFGSITVPPAGLVEREVTGDLRLRERLVFVVHDPVGAVVPALDHRNGLGDRGVTTGVPEAEEWYIPATGGVDFELALVNAGTFDVAVEVDAYTAAGVEIGVEERLLDARSVEFITVAADTALRVRADAPVGAAVRAEAGAGLALTMGVETESPAWILAGPGRDGGDRVISILNTSTDPLAVTYRILGPGGATEGRTVTVPPSSVLHQEVVVERSAGIVLEADAPFSVGWRSTIPDGPIALDQGIPRG